MLGVLALAVVLAQTPVPSPGDGLSLEPAPPAPAAGGSQSSPPGSPPGAVPLVPGGAAVAAAGVATTMVRRRRYRPVPRPVVPDDVVVVFVSGHGSGYGTTFDPLLANLPVPADQVRHFDYRWVVPVEGHSAASQSATVDEVADGLAAYLAGLSSADPRRIYLVGFSKGGVSIAELLARWDEHPGQRVPAVVGAALLDPPMAGGALGDLQSVGLAWGWVPDDGGYRPEQCSWLGLRCHDRRAHLGRAAGVEVVVFRNPDAVVTSFSDAPEGLRVYDVDDPGRSAWRQLFTNPFTLHRRIAEAHEYTKHSEAVAGCISRELWSPGSCPSPGRASGGGSRR